MSDLFTVIEADYEYGKRLPASERDALMRGVFVKEEWHEVSGGVSSYWDKKTPIEGTYVEKRDDSGIHHTKLYILSTKEGNVGVNGTSVLDSKFAQLMIGQEIRIEPLGEAKSKTSGFTYQDFKVLAREAPMKPVGEKPKEEAADIPIGDDIPF